MSLITQKSQTQIDYQRVSYRMDDKTELISFLEQIRSFQIPSSSSSLLSTEKLLISELRFEN